MSSGTVLERSLLDYSQQCRKMIDSQRRALSAYYTPREIAQALADWAIRDGTERILEPSVGSGALIRPALERAQNLLIDQKLNSALVCDVNPDALRALRASIPKSVACVTMDFLELEEQAGNYDVVLANPPFTRNHDLPPEKRSEFRVRFDVKGAAGLWVYILLHSIKFLADGGRIASIVPGSACFSAYGRDFLNRVCSLFPRVYLYQLPEKPSWEGGADDRGAILLADGYKQGRCDEPSYGVWGSTSFDAPIPPQIPSPFNALFSASTRIGEIAQISIGAVTGANEYFLLNEQEKFQFGLLEKDLQPIVSRARHLRGLTISADELRELGKAGQKTWLLHPNDIQQRRSPVRARLAQIPRKKRRGILWLNKRSPWWRVDVGSRCDAIFTYMNHAGPILSLAGPNVTCTNTLHRVAFRRGVTRGAQICAILSLLSTFGQFAAEGIGRVYGGGVLKFELGDARRMPVLLVPLDKPNAVLRQADTAFRAGAFDTARRLADEALAPYFLGFGWKAGMRELTEALFQTRSARQRGAPIIRF